MSTTNLTDDERLDRIEAIFEAEDKGDFEEANRLRLQIPLSVKTFNVTKSLFGSEYIEHLKNLGYDFSEVEAVYGKDYGKN